MHWWITVCGKRRQACHFHLYELNNLIWQLLSIFFAMVHLIRGNWIHGFVCRLHVMSRPPDGSPKKTVTVNDTPLRIQAAWLFRWWFSQIFSQMSVWHLNRSPPIFCIKSASWHFSRFICKLIFIRTHAMRHQLCSGSGMSQCSGIRRSLGGSISLAFVCYFRRMRTFFEDKYQIGNGDNNSIWFDWFIFKAFIADELGQWVWMTQTTFLYAIFLTKTKTWSLLLRRFDHLNGGPLPGL